MDYLSIISSNQNHRRSSNAPDATQRYIADMRMSLCTKSETNKVLTGAYKQQNQKNIPYDNI